MKPSTQRLRDNRLTREQFEAWVDFKLARPRRSVIEESHFLGIPMWWHEDEHVTITAGRL